MNKIRTQFTILFILFNIFVSLPKPVGAKTYAMVICGICRDKQYETIKTKMIIDLQSYLLNKTEVTSDTIKVLTPDGTGNNSSQFTNIKKVMSDFESVIKPEDKFIFFYTGQANVVNQQLRLNLPDEDITQVQLGELLKNIKASSNLIVLDCPASGLAVKELSAKDRIIICSCTDEQRFTIKFSEYFVPALNNTESDIDGDGKISILEAFIAASKNVQDWYRTKNLILTETPVLDDNGDGKASKEPWRYIIDMKDGLAASKFFLEKE